MSACQNINNRYISTSTLSLTVGQPTPGSDGGDGEALLQQEVKQPACLHNIEQTTHHTHHTEGEGAQVMFVLAVHRNNRIEHTETPLDEELAKYSNNHHRIKMKLGVAHTLFFYSLNK